MNFLLLSSLLALSAINSVGAFAGVGTTRSSSALHLLPSQGEALEAASNAFYGSEGMASSSAEGGVTTVASSSRSFVSRLFSLPSSMIKKHPKAELEGLPASKQQNIVLYPMIGFQFVKVDDAYRPLPTNSNAACRLVNLEQQEVYGWFSTGN
jgi:hypothetical protein